MTSMAAAKLRFVAGTSWDKLGQMEAAFEGVAPSIRAVAEAESARLHEFFRDDPVWRLDFTRRRPGDPAVDVSWSEDRPDEFAVSALWWEGESLTREDVGSYRRDRPAAELETLLRDGVAKLPSPQ
jgi:hypothetical protein